MHEVWRCMGARAERQRLVAIVWRFAQRTFTLFAAHFLYCVRVALLVTLIARLTAIVDAFANT